MFSTNTFLNEFITAWIQINNDKKHMLVSNRIFWNNENILIQNKTIFRKLWYKKEIKHISDINGYRKKIISSKT